MASSRSRVFSVVVFFAHRCWIFRTEGAEKTQQKLVLKKKLEFIHRNSVLKKKSLILFPKSRCWKKKTWISSRNVGAEKNKHLNVFTKTRCWKKKALILFTKNRYWKTFGCWKINFGLKGDPEFEHDWKALGTEIANSWT